MVRRITETELPSVEELILKLQIAHTKKVVRVHFKDGSDEVGAVTYVPRFGTGRLIDVTREFSRDYSIYDVADVDIESDI